MIRKILVANRGEIACRVFRTAHRMGIRTVAVFSDADRDALHTRSAGEAFHVGPAPAADSYLNIARLLEALTSSGADAVHPGYGFLAENPAFAEAVTHAGRTFVGPGPKAMRAVGNKRSARQLMQDAGLPVIPGVNDIDTLPALRDAASEIGFPIMLKAAAGGGGRGMRRVETPEELNTAFETCRREAQAAFGDARLLAERCIDYARHIEVQVLADSHGGFVHLFERDCSAQRRHQKILEEAPAPGIDPGMAHDIRTAAIAAARAVDYLGAGTVEFLVPEGGGFYFLEMNARLQVEHPRQLQDSTLSNGKFGWLPVSRFHFPRTPSEFSATPLRPASVPRIRRTTSCLHPESCAVWRFLRPHQACERTPVSRTGIEFPPTTIP